MMFTTALSSDFSCDYTFLCLNKSSMPPASLNVSNFSDSCDKHYIARSV